MLDPNPAPVPPSDPAGRAGGLPANVCIQSVSPDAQGVARAVAQQMSWLGLQPRRGDVWAIKLNLTYPEYLPGVVNSPIFVEGLCVWAADCGLLLEFIEGDGGNGSYSAQDAFQGNGVSALADRYGMKTTSISEAPWDWRETPVCGRQVRLPYSPYFVRRQYDRFLTAPLFKNHIFTIVTLGMKNLWGCLPDAYRMYYHHQVDHGIVALYKELRPDFSIFDGIIGLRGRGPMDGIPLAMNVVMSSASVGAGEAAALQIMGVPRARVKHLELARAEGLIPEPSELVWRESPTPFERTDFILDRTMLNHATIMLSHYPWLQRWIYHSPLSRFIYAIVDRLRPGSAQARLVQAKRDHKYNTITLDRR
jgi:uncharacterized protein (DUF362 family)